MSCLRIEFLFWTAYFFKKKKYVCISGVKEDQIINLYKDAEGGKAIATVEKGMEEVELSIHQLGSKAGSVFITVRNPECLESDRTECYYSAE